MDRVDQAFRDQLRLLGAQLATRDDVIRNAHKAGISKTEIHRLTGVARSTIDRILGHTRPADDRPGQSYLPRDSGAAGRAGPAHG